MSKQPSKQPKKVKYTPPDKIEATVMAIRESLLEYFKGSCVKRLMTSNIDVIRESTSGHYRFQELENEQQRRSTLYIGDEPSVPIMSLRQSPDTLTLHLVSLDRSKELKAVREGVERFMARHLKGVKIERNTTTRVTRYTTIERRKDVDDSSLMVAEVEDSRGNDGVYAFPNGEVYTAVGWAQMPNITTIQSTNWGIDMVREYEELRQQTVESLREDLPF